MDDDEFDPELEAKMQAALELNRKLQDMMRLHEKEQTRGSRSQHDGPPQRRSVAESTRMRKIRPPPRKATARSGGARNFTFNDGEMSNIENSNQHLLRRLSGIAVRDVRKMAAARQPRIKIKAAAGINRRKKQTAIQKQNQVSVEQWDTPRHSYYIIGIGIPIIYTTRPFTL